jgi:hypothetical protein
MKTMGTTATKNIRFSKNQEKSVYYCKMIIQDINREFFRFLIDNRYRYENISKEEIKKFKALINNGINFSYKIAIFTNDDYVKNLVCYYYPVTKCGLLSGFTRILSKSVRKIGNLFVSRPENSIDVKDILNTIKLKKFNNKYLSMAEIHLLGKIGTIAPDILNEDSYKMGDKILYNPIEKYLIFCNTQNNNPQTVNIHRQQTHTTFLDTILDPFTSYGQPYYGQPNYYHSPSPTYNPYTGRYEYPAGYGPGYGQHPHGQNPLGRNLLKAADSAGRAIERGARSAYNASKGAFGQAERYAENAGRSIETGVRGAYNAARDYNYQGAMGQAQGFADSAGRSIGTGARGAYNAARGYNYQGAMGQAEGFASSAFDTASHIDYQSYVQPAIDLFKEIDLSEALKIGKVILCFFGAFLGIECK